MNDGQLILVSAPSGAGKTSLVKAIMQQDAQLSVSISHTTRTQRSTEQDGVNYYFIDDAEFNAMIATQAFLEHAQVFDHQYGTSRAEVERLMQAGKDVILEIDWQGADQVRAVMPDAVSVFILPPSIRALEQRLTGRGQNSASSMARRLAEARLEIAQAPRYDYLIINDDFDQAVRDMLGIIRTRRLLTGTQLRQNALAQAILSDT